MPPEPGDDQRIAVRVASFDELDATTLYEILRLRSEVFVVEQRCVFLDLDGRDTEPTTTHLWLEDEGGIAGYARLMRAPDGGTSVGRVVTPTARRGAGLGTRLVRECLARGTRPVRLDAQEHLARWYTRFGFETCGPSYVEDGIAHVPMVLDAGDRP